jgi:hypothetical protein
MCASITIENGRSRAANDKLSRLSAGGSMNVEEIKRQWGYDGKPKQWQQGFDSMLRELTELISHLEEGEKAIAKLKLIHFSDCNDRNCGKCTVCKSKINYSTV